MQKKLRLEKLNLCYQCGKGQGSLGVKQVVRTALKQGREMTQFLERSNPWQVRPLDPASGQARISSHRICCHCDKDGTNSKVITKQVTSSSSFQAQFMRKDSRPILGLSSTLGGNNAHLSVLVVMRRDTHRQTATRKKYTQ